MPEPAGAIGYIRVSMKREDQISPETQQAAIEDAARRRGWRVTDWVTDLDKTGRNFQRRIMGAIERAEAGPAKTILVWKYSRFGRNRLGVAVNLARLEKAGGQLVSATEDVDAQTATGRFTRGMLFEVAAFESDRIGETWREAYDYRVAEGLPPLGRPRFGYARLGRVRDEEDPHRTRRDKDDPGPERYVPDPSAGPVLAGMYRAYAAGDGGPVIARRLNEQAVLNTYGRLWSARTVLDVLDSGFGAGLLRVHSPQCRCGAPARCPERARVRGRHEPVISEPEWEAYLRRREEAAVTPPRARKPAYPVSGLVFCWHCGAPMVVSGARKEKLRFKCSRHRNFPGTCGGRPSVPLEDLLGAVRAFLAGLAADEDAEAASVRARETAGTAAKADADRIGRDLAAADRQLARLALRAAEDDALPASAWQDAARELGERRAVLAGQLAAARREALPAGPDPLPLLGSILQAWETLPAPVLNRMLRAVIGRVEVRKTAPSERDDKGHFMPQQTEIEVIPLWAARDG